MESLLKIFIGSLSTFFVYFLGDFDVAIQTLIIVLVLDYLTGIMKSYLNATLNSNKGIKGIIKKIGYLFLIGLVVIIDRIIDAGGIIRNTVIYTIVANESLSIIENLSAMNIFIPNVVKSKLEQLKSDNNE